MEIGEIISDAIRYPLNNSKSLLIYIVAFASCFCSIFVALEGRDLSLLRL